MSFDLSKSKVYLLRLDIKLFLRGFVILLMNIQFTFLITPAVFLVTRVLFHIYDMMNILFTNIVAKNRSMVTLQTGKDKVRL